MQVDYDVIILGGGAAGLSAAVYTTRAMLKTAVIEKLGAGGQILTTGEIENYPGFPDGVDGPELAQLMERQAVKFGAELRYEEITGLRDEGEVKRVTTAEGEYTARAVIIATGGSHRKLGVPGEEEFAGRGVSYCAVCDGNFFRDQDVVVVGGGDAAMDEGLYLTSIVRSVTVVHRRDQLRASPVLQQRAFAHPKMRFLWSHVVEEVRGTEAVDRVLVRNLKTGERYEHPTSAVFIYIGFVANSEFLKGVVPLDETGHVVCNIRMETPVPGIFVAGDIRQYSDRQLGTAVGDGITAALSAYRYLTEGGNPKRD